MTSLLVATDFSPDAANAARRAASLADALGAREMRLLHVAPCLPLAAELELKASRAIERALEGEVEALRRDTGRAFSPQIRAGGVVEEICRAARADDLVVVGARGLHPLRDFAIGATAERLLRRSVQPVLVVKRPPAGPYRSVLAPVDFSADSAAALDLALRAAPGAEVRVVHAFAVDIEPKLRFAGVPEEEIHRHRREARERGRVEMEKLLAPRRQGAWITPVLEHGYAPAVIDEAARSGADLVALGRRGTSLLEDLLLGSVTQHVLASAACDVLVVRSAR